MHEPQKVVDEFELRDAAIRLKNGMEKLAQAKYTKPQHTGEPVSGGAGFGPRAPGNETAISLYCEIERELSRWLIPIGCDRHGVFKQLEWVAFYNYRLAYDLDAESLLEELRRWITTVENLLGIGPTIKDLAAKPERRQTARSICHRLHKWGYNITPELLRKWAERKEITTTKCKNGKNLYLLSEVVHKCRVLTETTVIIE